MEINILQLSSTAASVGALVFGIVKYAFSGFNKLIDIKFDKLDNRLGEIELNQKLISKELTDFKLDVISKYLNRAEFESSERSNSASHAVMHGRMDDINQRVTVIETIQKQCKGCNG
jgi:hypothetical protein